MIIKFPTALYNSVLPQVSTDTQNITFLVSSTDPPRSSDSTLQLLRSQEIRPLPATIFTKEERRNNLGKLIFSINSGKQSHVGIGNKQFEVGQVLEFGDVTLEELDDLEVPNVVELQQNTNELDTDAFGLEADEVALLIRETTGLFNTYISQLNEMVETIKNTESEISDNQKLINEVNKAKRAAQIAFVDSSSDIITKLAEREEELISNRSSLIKSLNEYTAEANEIYNKIISLREMVR